MDLKRYRPISWKTAIIKVLNGERVHRFNPSGSRVTFHLNDIDALVEKAEGVGTFINGTGLNSFAGRSGWYLEKEFDVRSEMLSRPNEWVGAYRDEHGLWKVGFNTIGMCVVTCGSNGVSENIQVLDYVFSDEGYIRQSSEDLLNDCIPIEDVPKEDLQ